MMLQYPERPRNQLEKLQARLEWLINNQPHNFQAISAIQNQITELDPGGTTVQHRPKGATE